MGSGSSKSVEDDEALDVAAAAQPPADLAQENSDADPRMRVDADALHRSTVGSTSVVNTSTNESALVSPNKPASGLSPQGQSSERSDATAQDASVNMSVTINSNCSHCQVSVNATPCPTQFQQVHALCYCCKSALSEVTRHIVHPNFAMAHLRFCFPCFERNGSELMAQIQTTKQPATISCSGCLQEKPRKEFHKRQQILRPWEEMPGQKHLCLTCLPDGFERDEAAMVPQKMRCAKCDCEKDRVAFVLSVKERFGDLDLLRQWVNDALFECDLCLFKAACLAQCLTCSSCDQLLKRKKFPSSQQRIAMLEDENPCHSGCKPTYTCIGCTEAALPSQQKLVSQKQAGLARDSSTSGEKKKKANVHPSYFQRVHQLCHCCKTVVGNIKREIIHPDFAMVHLSFCHSCYADKGSEFMAQVRVMKPPVAIKCSGCLQDKPRKEFHKQQQILRPWEELPGQKHFCLVCLPGGFENDEDATVPQKMKCVQCDSEKDRAAFVRSLNEQALGCDEAEDFQRWINSSKFVCDHCLLGVAQTAQCLTCSTCKQLLSRIKFPQNQRWMAKLEDENPGQLGHKPVYKCLDCKPLATPPQIKDKRSQVSKSMLRTDSSRLVKMDNAVAHPTSLQAVHQHCHSCKTATGTIVRDIIHPDFAMVHLRFCASCFDLRGREFMAQVRIMKPPAIVKCAGCLEDKSLKNFHKRQQILRPWEELPGRKHYCLACLPAGFEKIEDSIVPQGLLCGKCENLRNRVAFVRSISERAPSSDNFDMLRQWVNESIFECDHCLFLAGHAAQRLSCSTCKQLLSRNKFSDEQRVIAKEEDGNPGHLGHEPVYTCLNCLSLSSEHAHDECLDDQMALPGNSSPSSETIDIEMTHPIAFEFVLNFCHCCKSTTGGITRGIIHPNPKYGMVDLRFCSSCFDIKGSEFMALVRTMTPPAIVKCSGCLRNKSLKDFHKRQQILRPWEELPGRKHYCLACLPTGFENFEDSIVPKVLKCVKCDNTKDRLAFVRSISEKAQSSNNLDVLRQWVNDAVFVCDHCLFLAGHDAQRLLCSTCKHLFSRKRFSKEQRAMAVLEDENPGQSGRKLVFTCSGCVSTALQAQRDHDTDLAIAAPKSTVLSSVQNDACPVDTEACEPMRNNDHHVLETHTIGFGVVSDRDPDYGHARHFIFDHRNQ